MSNDDQLPPLTGEERDAASAWPGAEPSADFAARVVAAWEEARPPERVSRRRSGLLALPAVAAAVVALVFAHRGAAPASGSRRVSARDTIELGRRGLAVAEAGSDLSFAITASGEASIDQRSGDVFYRVEKGGPFVVRTGAGEARVQGTCFRVEVRPMATTNPKWLHMGLGAAAASAVLVTVYEGKVLLANERGQAAIVAGEQAAAGSDGAPAKLSREDPQAAEKAIAPAGSSTPGATATRDELLKPYQAQRTELDTLRARVRELEAHPSGDGVMPGEKSGAAKAPFFAPSKDELDKMAKECRLKWDAPSIGPQPQAWGQKKAEENGLSEAERLEMNRVSAETNARVVGELRALYLEVTGDKAGADSLTPSALQEEIVAKSRERDTQDAFARLSRERAGQLPAPADVKSLPPVDRLHRLLSGLGDAYERDLGAAIGPDLAHELRRKNDGWGSHHSSSYGCPDDR